MDVIDKDICEGRFSDPPFTKYDCVLAALIYCVDQVAKLINSTSKEVRFIDRSTRAENLRCFIEKGRPVVNFSAIRCHTRALPIEVSPKIYASPHDAAID